MNRKYIGALGWIVLLMGWPMSGYGNDGFFDGAGATLYPIHNRDMHVVSENLVITPVHGLCYGVEFRGKPINRNKAPTFGPDDFALVGQARPCGIADSLGFSPSWHAEAVYRVEARSSQNDVLMGFPVPTWRGEVEDQDGDLLDIPVPGAINFRTFFNGKELTPLATKWLATDAHDSSKGKTLGYTWTMSFPKGKDHFLRTSYDFGQDLTNGFYEDHDYVSGEAPWFLEIYRTREGNQRPSARRMIYYLKPLSLWSGAPDRVAITVARPENVPITCMVPLKLKPSCVDEDHLYYVLRNAVPSEDLEVSYPSFALKANGRPESAPNLKTPQQWEQWKKTLGGKEVAMACGLIRGLQGAADPDLAALLKEATCVKSCP